MKTKEIHEKIAVLYPLSYVWGAAGKSCVMQSGGLLRESHLVRNHSAVEAVEKKESRKF